MKKQTKDKILIIDDEEDVRNFLKDALAGQGFQIDLSSSSKKALTKMNKEDYNLVLIDVNMPGVSGHELLKISKKDFPETEVVMITGKPEIDSAIATVRDGAYDYVAKPFDMKRLMFTIRNALTAQKSKSGESLQNVMPAKQQNSMGYKVIRNLGAGNMGIVLLVEKKGKYYAMKLLRQEEDESNFELKSRKFLREAEILKKIDHPNVVKIFEFGVPKGKDIPYIVTEYVDGKSLSYYLKTGVLPLDQKISIISQVASGLGAIHKCGILHRDIKPKNILVTENAFVKISDFGIARFLDSSQTVTNELMGSPAYMSPESFDRKGRVDIRADIFSLGVLSYELITGIKPFDADNIIDLVDTIQGSKPIDPIKLVPRLPPWIQGILGKMLAKDAKDRFKNTREITKLIKYYKSESLEKIKKSKTQKLIRIISPKKNIWS